MVFLVVFLIVPLLVIFGLMIHYVRKYRRYEIKSGFYQGAYMRLRVWDIDNALQRAVMYDDTKEFEIIILRGDTEIGEWGAPGDNIVDEIFENSKV